MSDRNNVSLQRLKLMERASSLRKEINEKRYRRQNLISEIKPKREEAARLRKKRDSLNKEVKELIAQAKEHIKQRDEIQEKIREIRKELGAVIRSEIQPRAERIRKEKETRRALNRAARASPEELEKEFEASLKTLFDSELSLREEVIMVEMVMDVVARYNSRKSADDVSTDIKKTYEEIKEIEPKKVGLDKEIMALTAEAEKEHRAAMDLFDRKNELSRLSQEAHEAYVALSKEIRDTSAEIDAISKDIEKGFEELKPLEKELDSIRFTRRKQQELEKLRAAKEKMNTTGKIGLEDLRVLLESNALPLNNKGNNSGEKGAKKGGKEKKKRN